MNSADYIYYFCPYFVKIQIQMNSSWKYDQK